MQVGQVLREARLKKGIDLYEVKRVTKISVPALRAMEEDRWDAVPADEAEADLSAYARFLGWTRRRCIEQYEPTADADKPEEAMPGVIEPGGRSHTPGGREWCSHGRLRGRRRGDHRHIRGRRVG